MTDCTLELLEKEKVVELWSDIEPLLGASAVGNVISADEMDATYVLGHVLNDEAVIFAGFIDGKLSLALAIQFSEANGHKCADIIALSGEKLMTFKRLYWKPVLKWLEEVGVEFLDAYVPDRRAVVYMDNFGFDKSCTYMRKSLGAASHG